MPIGSVLDMNDLLKIQALLAEEGYGDYELKIVIPLISRAAFNKVNEEFYYKNFKEGTPPDVDKIEVKVSNITFEYTLEENDVV